MGHDHSDAPLSAITESLDGSGRQLARGSLTVAAGLSVTGAATLGLLALVNHDHALNASGGAAAFNVWWVMTTLLSATFGVFEAFLSRLAVTEHAAGRSPSGVIGVLLGRCWLVAGGIAVVVLSMGPWLDSHEFGGFVSLTLLLPVFVFLAATQSVQRAAATGRGRFPAIAAQLGTDGLLRITISAALVASGHATVLLLALGTCIAAAGGLIAGQLTCPGWFARPTLRGTDVPWRPVLLLLASAAGPLLAASGPVPWLKATGHVTKYTIDAFTGAITVSRIPTQFVAAAFGPLLAQLANAIELAEHATFLRLRKKAEVAAVALGVVFVVGFAGLGVWAIPLFAPTPPGQSLSLGILALLAAAGAMMFFAVVQQASLAALDRWGYIAAAWIAGTLVLAGTLLIPASSLQRASLAPVTAIATACVIMSALLRSAARGMRQPPRSEAIR